LKRGRLAVASRPEENRGQINRVSAGSRELFNKEMRVRSMRGEERGKREDSKQVLK
jgi:hypothetical protein